MRKKHRVIIDTNLWISFLLTKQFAFIDKMLGNGRVQLIFSMELLTEFVEVAKRPKLSKYFPKQELTQLLEWIELNAEFVTVSSEVHICRDEKDNFLLSLAKDSKADYLITGDQDLLIIKKFENTEIITIAEFKLKKI